MKISRKSTALALATALVSAPLAAVTVLAPTAAQARICSVDHVVYNTPKKGVTVWIPTSLYAIWGKGGTQTREATEGSESSKTSGRTDQLGGEVGAGFSFVSASATYNHTWDRSTSSSRSYSSSWSYTINLPDVKSRARLYHKGYRFPVTQTTVYTNGCPNRVTSWRTVVPVTKTGNAQYFWTVERYSRRGQLK